MADPNSTRARGLRINDYYWGRIAEGTREMLIQHGYTLDDIFPGDPGARKIIERGTDPAGRAIKIQRKSKYVFSVERKWSDGEAAAYRVTDEKRRAHSEEIERATKLVNSWPKSGAAYRDETHKTVEAFLSMTEMLIAKGIRGGYRYDDDAILRFRLMADQMMQLVDSRTIVKDLALREQHTPACIAKSVRAVDAAKQDVAFQQWIDYAHARATLPD